MKPLYVSVYVGGGVIWVSRKRLMRWRGDRNKKETGHEVRFGGFQMVVIYDQADVSALGGLIFPG